MFETSSMRSSSSRRRVRGFTLVEILIVVAIVGVLAAMLLPALGRSKSQAKLMSCRNRLRNVGIGLRLYADEHEDVFPVTTCLDGEQVELVEALHDEYIQDARNFYCPCETNPLRKYSVENFKAGRIGYFYYSCREPSRNRDISGFLRIDVPWPRELHSTMEPDTWVMSDGWYRGESTPHQEYKKGMNYLTLSGVVEFVSESPRSSFK